MEFKIVKDGNSYVHYDETGKINAKISFKLKGENIVVVDSTFVDPDLRGKGIADKLLDHLVKEMAVEGKKIEAKCSYIEKKFAKNPQKYNFINADA